MKQARLIPDNDIIWLGLIFGGPGFFAGVVFTLAAGLIALKWADR